MKIIINEEYASKILDVLLDQYMEQREQLLTLMGSIESDILTINDDYYWNLDEVKQTDKGLIPQKAGLAYTYQMAKEEKPDFIISIHTYPQNRIVKMNMNLLQKNKELVSFLTEFYEGMLDHVIHISGIISPLGQLNFYRYHMENNTFEKVDWELQKTSKRGKKRD